MLWCSVYFYQDFLNNVETQVLCIADGYKDETFETISLLERCKNQCKFGGTKVYKVEEVRKYFVNPKLKIKSTAMYKLHYL